MFASGRTLIRVHEIYANYWKNRDRSVFGCTFRFAKKGPVPVFPAIYPEFIVGLGLEFLGTLVAAGCDESMLDHLLQGLEKPFNFRINRIYFDWISKHWRLLPEVPEIPEIQPDEVFEQWLEELEENGDVEQLRELAESVTQAIERCKSDS